MGKSMGGCGWEGLMGEYGGVGIIKKCGDTLIQCTCLVWNRAYLKSVAKKLAEDVDNLKTSASTLGKVRYVC